MMEGQIPLRPCKAMMIVNRGHRQTWIPLYSSYGHPPYPFVKCKYYTVQGFACHVTSLALMFITTDVPVYQRACWLAHPSSSPLNAYACL